MRRPYRHFLPPIRNLRMRERDATALTYRCNEFLAARVTVRPLANSFHHRPREDARVADRASQRARSASIAPARHKNHCASKVVGSQDATKN
ncbi:hypothetical protein EMEDMD4_910008 [Sinorhizobium medicae]|uniref:Uncharacterized protein n=1 Tax=Sinorhizobium medicae TaxID=110321 RepID=A0A508X889_9HYPH|nr:hypothetical protein EMEDMD4_910008 [Sinorhizobium medicae]